MSRRRRIAMAVIIPLKRASVTTSIGVLNPPGSTVVDVGPGVSTAPAGSVWVLSAGVGSESDSGVPSAVAWVGANVGVVTRAGDRSTTANSENESTGAVSVTAPSLTACTVVSSVFPRQFDGGYLRSRGHPVPRSGAPIRSSRRVDRSPPNSARCRRPSLRDGNCRRQLRYLRRGRRRRTGRSFGGSRRPRRVATRLLRATGRCRTHIGRNRRTAGTHSIRGGRPPREQRGTPPSTTPTGAPVTRDGGCRSTVAALYEHPKYNGRTTRDSKDLGLGASFVSLREEHTPGESDRSSVCGPSPFSPS